MERLGIEYAVLLDPAFSVWRMYGNRGWPGRYLFDRRGKLRYVHYGEGDYLDCEAAIGEVLSELDEDFSPPPPLEPVRPEDVPGVRLEPQTADIALPADAERLKLVRDWIPGEDYLEAEDAGVGGRVHLLGRRGLGGPVRRRPRARALRGERRPRGGRRPGPAPARSAVHAGAAGLGAAAMALRISFGSMKRTSSWTTSYSETSVVPRSRKKSTSDWTSSSGALAPEEIPTTRLPSSHSSCTWDCVVDQVGVGAVVAGHLHQAVGVRGVA